MNTAKLIAYRQLAEDTHHNQMSLIDQIIAEHAAHDCAPATSERTLDVPWLSQLGPGASYARGDCGPACLAMWLNFRGHNLTVDDVSRATDKARGFLYTNVGDLISTAREFGLSLVWGRNQTLADLHAQIDAGRPVIVLVYYPALPDKFDPNYKYCHWIEITGYEPGVLYYHDSYRRAKSDGAHIEISDSDFMSAWSQNYRVGNKNRQLLKEVG